MNKNKMRLSASALLLASIMLFASATIYSFYQFEMIGKIKSQLEEEDPLEAWSELSYIIWQYNSTFYGTRNMSTLAMEYFGTNDDTAIQTGIDACTTYGGTVYVKAPTYTGTYNAVVTLKDKVTLIIEQGALGITVTIDSGATATLLDYQNYDFKHWEFGTLVTFIEDCSQNEAYSYVVFTQSISGTQWYFAKNGSTGSIDYSGTNPATVFNNVLAQMKTVHGTLFIKKATYLFTTAPGASGEILEVDLRGGYGDFIIDSDGAILQGGVNANFFMLIYGGANVTIRNLVFDGQNTDNLYYALAIGYYEGSEYFTIENCQFKNWLDPDLDYQSIAIMSYGGSNTIIRNCYFENCAQCICGNGGNADSNYWQIINNRISRFRATGISFEQFGSEHTIRDHIVKGNIIETTINRTILAMGGIIYTLASTSMNIKINDNTVKYDCVFNSKIGIRITDGCNHQINDNTVIGAVDTTGYLTAAIFISGTQNCTISNNVIDNLNKQGRGIKEKPYPDAVNFTLITNNIIVNTYQPINLEAYSNSIAKDNILDVPNWGIATLGSGTTSVWVTVGYVTSRSLVFLSIIESDATEAGEYLKVNAFSPILSFQVMCGDEGAASTDIVFAYEVIARG